MLWGVRQPTDMSDCVKTSFGVSFRVSMGLRPTHRDETHPRCRPRESGDPRPVDSRSPAFAEDKFRGNDVTFEGANYGDPSLL
jgi:hypothetical protein